MHQIPCVLWFQRVSERRHWGSVQAGHENLVKILVGFATAEPSTVVKIVRTNRLTFVVRQGDGGRTISAAFGPMTFPALHLIEQLPAMKHAIDGLRWFRWNCDGSSCLLSLPFRRKSFDVSNQVDSSLRSERPPRGHQRVDDSPGDRIVQILVGRQSPRRGGSP